MSSELGADAVGAALAGDEEAGAAADGLTTSETVIKAMAAAEAPVDGELLPSRVSERDPTDVAEARGPVATSTGRGLIGRGLPTVWLMESLSVTCVLLGAGASAAELEVDVDPDNTAR